jgi:hypothetical protein
MDTACVRNDYYYSLLRAPRVCEGTLPEGGGVQRPFPSISPSCFFLSTPTCRVEEAIYLWQPPLHVPQQHSPQAGSGSELAVVFVLEYPVDLRMGKGGEGGGECAQGSDLGKGQVPQMWWG